MHAQVEGLGCAEFGGLTLFVSVPLCRLLSESELISLIAGELVRCHLVPPDWETWINSTYARWATVAESDNAPFFYLLWQWAEEWSTWSLVLSLWSMQRSAAIAGRENAAAALVIGALLHEKWAGFLSKIQIELRRGAIDPAKDQVNLSERFATEMTATADGLAASYSGTNDSGTPALPALTAILEIDAAAVGRRITSGITDTASDLLAGLKRLELDLSSQQINRIFFAR